MITQIEIKKANLSDPLHARHVIQLLDNYASDIMGGGKNLPEEVKQNLIPELKKRSSSIVLLAYDGDTPAGLIIAFEGFSTFYAKPLINIHDFVVCESHRGKGIARSMLEKTEEIARERGCCKLTLEVLDGNKRAQKVYQAFGFSGYELDPEMGKAVFLDKKLV